MKIGVLSDTHIRGEKASLPPSLYQAFKGVDLILHAGDINHMSVLEKLRKKCGLEVLAVAGNTDLFPTYRDLKDEILIERAGFRIGLRHRAGRDRSIRDKENDKLGPDTLRRFSKKPLDVLVFGHSHCPYNEVYEGVLLFNPGSVSHPRCGPRGTVGILEVGEKVQGRIIEL